MKRFMVFAGNDYYASGGWNDFVADFDTFECAKTFANSRHTEHWREDKRCFGGLLAWVHIVDTEQRKIIWRCDSGEEELV